VDEASRHSPIAPVPAHIYRLCRRLRRTQTSSEAILWEALRSRRVAGLKFRRQHPFGRYIADFYCPQAGLVVEIDGPNHNAKRQLEYDRSRDEELVSRDLRIIRFTTEQEENNPEHVLSVILQATRDS